MTKISCSDLSCKYLNDKNICTAKNISLGWHSVVTAHHGRQEFLSCSSYEESEEFKRAKDAFETMMDQET